MCHNQTYAPPNCRDASPLVGPESGGTAASSGSPRYTYEIGWPLARREAFRRQRLAARIMRQERVAGCGWALIDGGAGVDVVKGESRARFVGLQACGSIWMCPACAARIAETRRRELNQALAAARAEGLAVFLVTLTFRHGAGEPLVETLGALKASMKALRQHRAWKRLKASGLVGNIVGTEITEGLNGFHPHAHMLAFWSGDADDGAASLEALRAPWMASLAGQGRGGNGAAFDVRDGSAAGRYVAKWGAAEELALGVRKASKKGGRTPWQILDETPTSGRARALFFEYAMATKGRRALVWSNGLKARFGVDEVADSDAAEVSPEVVESLVLSLRKAEWSEARKRGRAEILEAAEAGGAGAVVALLTSPPGPSDHGPERPQRAAEAHGQTVRKDGSQPLAAEPSAGAHGVFGCVSDAGPKKPLWAMSFLRENPVRALPPRHGETCPQHRTGREEGAAGSTRP